MSNLEFIIAMATVVLALVAVIVGVIFLAVKSAKRNANDRYVYITATGRCYHDDPVCGGNDQKTSIKHSKAVRKGYSPCSRCAR